MCASKTHTIVIIQKAVFVFLRSLVLAKPTCRLVDFTQIMAPNSYLTLSSLNGSSSATFVVGDELSSTITKFFHKEYTFISALDFAPFWFSSILDSCHGNGHVYCQTGRSLGLSSSRNTLLRCVMTWKGYEPDANVLPSFSLILLLIVLISKMYFFQNKTKTMVT